jgi:outer membrane biosynthesis protein TonB
MKTASVISTLGHGAFLAWALLTFTGDKFEVTPAESLPVDLITASEFSQMTKGAKDAPTAEAPKPVVEKKAEPKPVEEIKPQVTEKKEVAPTQASAPPPPAQPQPDIIGEKIKKEEKQEAKNEPKPLPPKKPQPNQPKFDADKVAALLDKRQPQRQAATGDEPNSTPSLGAATGNAARLSQTELDALRARLMALWNPPIGIKKPEELIIRIRMRLRRDGKLAVAPEVITQGTGDQFNSARDSAVRAIYRGQPFDMLKPEHYETWKDVEVTFDPRDMFRG